MRRMAIWMAAALVVVLLGACVLPGDKSLYPVAAGAPAVRVYIIDNGFHVDLAAPRSALMRPGTLSHAAAARLPESPWVMLGWGDASYYRGSVGVRSRQFDGLRALLRPGNPSVIRLESLDRAPPDAFAASSVTAVTLSAEGFERLARRLDRSFVAKDGAPAVVETREGERREVYFASTEHFSIAKSCVHWQSQLLNAAGVPGHRFFDGLVVGLLWDLRLRAGVKPHAAASALPPGGG